MSDEGSVTCPSCARTAARGDRFCATCGASLEWAPGGSYWAYAPPHPGAGPAPHPGATPPTHPTGYPSPYPPGYPSPYPPGYPSPYPPAYQSPYPPGYASAYPGYADPYPGYPGYPARRTNGLAVASLILGIVWIWGVTSVLALVFGCIALRQIRERNEGGRGMALAGVILGSIGIAGTVLAIVLAVVNTNPGPPPI